MKKPGRAWTAMSVVVALTLATAVVAVVLAVARDRAAAHRDAAAAGATAEAPPSAGESASPADATADPSTTVAPTGSGRIAGLVRYAGSAPLRVKQLTNDIDVATCGERIALQTVILGADGVMANAFVEVRREDGGLPLPAPPRTGEESSAATRRCRIEPHVLIVPAGNALLLHNADGILHHLVVPALRNEPFDARLPRYRKRLRVPETSLRRPEILEVACDVHPWEAGFWIVSDNPLRALSDADGRFAIEGVPAGSWRLSAWHEDQRRTEIDVTVAAGQSVEVEIVYR